ncbi:MAG: hypothetical protein K0S11_1518, partial [Gammaproteobacteria bacterium]|nr:hypothetical protein [Gammaproteobacteria bacterium]
MAKRSLLLCLSLLLLLQIQPAVAQLTPIALKDSIFLSVSFAFINVIGLILIFIGIIFLLSEIILCSYGILAIYGLIIFTLGLFMLVDNHILPPQLAWLFFIAMAIVTLGLLIFTIYLGVKSHRRKIVSGQETLIDQMATVVNSQHEQAWIRIQGE